MSGKVIPIGSQKMTLAKIQKMIPNLTFDPQGFDNSDRDQDGQIVFYTGVYEWKDSTYRTEPDPSYNFEEYGCCPFCGLPECVAGEIICPKLQEGKVK